MNRKDFMLQTGAAMLAFVLPLKNTYAFGPDDQTAGACIPTTTDILGPYYRPGAPFRSDLTIAGDPGTILNYKGKITDENCRPLADAIVDVWQANSDAAYDGTSADYKYRGKFQTGADGTYSFRSVKPGWYLNGGQYRPAHIHFRVTKEGYTELITQLYFVGDPYIANDPWASDPAAEKRIVPIAVAGGEDTALFDITLQGSTTGIGEKQQASPVTLAPNPVRDLLSFTSPVTLQNIEVCNVAGQLVLSAYGLNVKEYRLPVQSLRRGLYFCRIETAKGIYVHRFVKE
ncbi:dioxygenase family protein [Taibaiella koreensis]|uniref:dioxygenase family protein n=1 Tax=Taibaiella koreensis TaxID=1268548 RepID=UPI000E59C427|nr:T9SS type A sorting domain-containing protein [Taibaiella koreensis]